MCSSRVLKILILLLLFVVGTWFFIISLNLKCEVKVVCMNQSVLDEDIHPKAPHPWELELNFTNFDNDLGTIDGHYIVPNYVHFVQFGERVITFPQTVCILSALKNQRPDKLFIHTDLSGFEGKYWNILMNYPGFKDVLVIEKRKMPTQIFNQTLKKKWAVYHGGDIARMEILLKYGGIYLDNDAYIARNMNDLRRYEFTLGWRPGKVMGNQIVLAHKNSRFLKLWYESYRNNYKPNRWYYNTGVYPTRHILEKKPYLVHRVEKLFGIYNNIRKSVYTTKFNEWKDYYGYHLMVNRLNNLRNVTKTATYPIKFNDENVLNYPVGFRTLCLDVYPFPEESVKNLIF